MLNIEEIEQFVYFVFKDYQLSLKNSQICESFNDNFKFKKEINKLKEKKRNKLKKK